MKNGAQLHEYSLVPAAGARIAKARFGEWLDQSIIGNS